MKRLLSPGIFLLLAMLLVPLAARAGAPDFPAPKNADVEWVGADIVRNGIPMSIRLFRVDDSVEDVLAYYRALWDRGFREGEKGYREDESAPWQIITRLEGSFMLSVQVQPGDFGGSWGYLGLSRLPIGEDAEEHRPKPFPMMSGSQLMNDTESRDVGRQARTLMVLNGFSVQSNAEYYRSHYTGLGWSGVMDSGTESGRMHSLVFERGSQMISISIAANGDGRTTIVANLETR